MKSKKLKIKNFILYSLLAICCLLFAVPAIAQVKLETALPAIPNQPEPGAGLPQYIKYLFIFGLGSITILALTQMIIGGILYILAAGNVAKVEDAKDYIFQALLGLGVLLISYLLLRTINPDLVNLNAPNLTPTQLQNQNPGPPSSREGTSCNPGDTFPGYVCAGSPLKWTKVSSNTSKSHATIALIN